MKRLLYSLLTLTVLFSVASCEKEPFSQTDPTLGAVPVAVTFNVGLSSTLTKADRTALDDGSTVDRLYVAAFSTDGTLIGTSMIGGEGYQPVAAISNGQANVTLTLAQKQDYKVVFFAMKEGAYTVSFGDGNQALFSLKDGPSANSASLDAFYKVVDVVSTQTSYSVALVRPFAQVNVFVPNGNVPANKTEFRSTMTVKQVPESFDLFTGKAGTVLKDVTFTESVIDAAAFGKYAGDYKWVAMNFVPVPASGKVDISFKEADMEKEFAIGIPVKVNGRTNLVGDLYAIDGVIYTVTVNPVFDNDSEATLDDDAKDTEIVVADGSTYTQENPLTIDASVTPDVSVRLSINGDTISQVNAGAESDKAVTAESADPSIATVRVVDDDVVISAVSDGETVVTVSTPLYTKAVYKEQTFRIPVKVISVPKEKVTPVIYVTAPADGKLSLEVGETAQITAELRDGETVLRDLFIYYDSSDEEVAKMSETDEGLVMAKNAGVATITLTSDPTNAYNSADPVTITVTVTDAEPPITPEEPDGPATLTNAEIRAATVNAEITGDNPSYRDGTIASTSGTWTGNYAQHANGVKYLQLRNKKGAYVTSPVFSSPIQKVEITLTSDQSVTLSDRTLHAVPPGTVLPTGQQDGKDITYSETEWAQEYGCVRTGADQGATVTIEFAEGSDIRQFMLIVEGGATYIDEITVRFSSPVISGPTVTTESVNSVTNASAVLSGSFSGMTDVRDYGFYWGTSPSALSNQTHLNSSANAAENFSSPLSSLESSTTYYYQAYVEQLEGDELKEYKGAVGSFTTASGQGQGGYRPYLYNYEIPAISLKAGTTYGSGSEKSGCGYKWYNHELANLDQMVATHTYMYDSKVMRNYTCLVDKNKKAPLWSAFVMHKDAYPNNNVGRVGSWTDDPAIPSGWQQSGVDQPYSRGHFVASNYRQANSDANKATFYHTNQAPQYQTSFNDGVWNSLENAVKSNAPSGRDTLYVVVGVLYESSQMSSGVPIPSHFYKLLMKCSFGTDGIMTAAKGVAYLYTNEEHSGDNYNDAKFRTTIDAIEERSGFDFFANVPLDLQDAAERQSASLW